MQPPYVELGTSSAFSFLEAATLPEDLAACAAELGYDAMALADRGGVYGIPRFHQAAVARGVRPIVGARLDVEGIGWIRLLCESQQGYRNLCRLLTLGHASQPKGKCLASPSLLHEHAEGLICLAGPGLHSVDLSSIVPLRRIFSGDTFRRLHPNDSARLNIEVARHLDRHEEARASLLLDLARAARLPAVATGDVRHARPASKPLLDVLTCIRAHTTLDAAGRRLLPNAEWHLKSPAHMAAFFADRPDVVRQSRIIAERCSFTLAGLGYRFPEFPLPQGETPASLLRRLTFAGAAERYRPLGPRQKAQLETELSLITKLDLCGYFLIVWDITRFAREQGILAQGRGSAANSAVCYSLGITAVDPVGMDLLFERFLSEERGEWPDIDLDLPSGDEREKVIQYVYERYGPHGAAMTANVITYRERSALREVGKVLGFAPAQVDAVAKLGGCWGRFDEDPALLASRVQAAGLDPKERRVALWLELAAALMRLPRHLGQHSGGLVVAAGRLDEITPIEPASMPGRTVIQWDKDDCADLKIIKVDLLGLGMLAALEEAVPLIRKSEGVEIDYAHLPQSDPLVFEMLRRADTVGVFQVESRAQMVTLPRLKPRTFYDLVIEIAIIRPGPIVGKMVHPYLARRAGREPVCYAHPALEPILARTLGVPLFQEQLMRIAMAVAGFSGGEAEELRRAMGFKRSNERMAEIEKRLRAGMSKNGLTPAAQDEIVTGITSFAAYGFPESHSASFALIAYASAYLKAHHPAAFLAALLNAWPMGFYHPATLVKDAQRHGVHVRPIDVTASRWRSTLDDRNTVRLGLCFVQGLRQASAERLLAARAEAPFTSLADLERRARLANRELMTLAELGAFAALGESRRAALWQVARLRERTEGLLGRITPAPKAARLKEMSLLERVSADGRNGQLSVGPHPMRFLRERLERDGVLSAVRLRDKAHGERARTAGVVIVRQQPMTASGFFFITLEDETGFANLIVTPDVFEANRSVLIREPGLWVEGVVQNQDGVVHLKADRFRPLSCQSAVAEPRSWR